MSFIDAPASMLKIREVTLTEIVSVVYVIAYSPGGQDFMPSPFYLVVLSLLYLLLRFILLVISLVDVGFFVLLALTENAPRDPAAASLVMYACMIILFGLYHYIEM